LAFFPAPQRGQRLTGIATELLPNCSPNGAWNHRRGQNNAGHRGPAL